jgi:esterase/lipase
LPIIRLIALFELGFNYEYYAAINLIKKVKVPIFILSAKHDEILNSKDARDIYDKANKPKKYWQANTVHRIFIDNPEEFKKKTLAFLLEYA